MYTCNILQISYFALRCEIEVNKRSSIDTMDAFGAHVDVDDNNQQCNVKKN